MVPGAVSSCLVPGNRVTGLPVSVACGTGVGDVEIWNQNDRKPLMKRTGIIVTEADRQANRARSTTSVTKVRCMNARNSPPVVLATTSSGHVVQLVLQANRIHPLGCARYHTAPATDVAWNSTTLASCGEDGVVNVFELGGREAEKPTRSMSLDGVTVNSLQFVDSNCILAVGSSPGARMVLFDIRDRASGDGSSVSTTRFEQIGSQLNAVAIHSSVPDRAATGGNDGSLALWDLRKLSLLAHHSNVHHDSIWSVVFHPEKPNVVLSASEDGTVKWSGLDVPMPESMALSSNLGIGVNSLDACHDEIGGPLVMIGSDDESVSVQQLLI